MPILQVKIIILIFPLVPLVLSLSFVYTLLPTDYFYQKYVTTWQALWRIGAKSAEKYVLPSKAETRYTAVLEADIAALKISLVAWKDEYQGGYHVTAKK